MRASPILAVLLLMPPAAAAPPSGRLGRDVVPLAESVRLELDPRPAGYQASVEVDLRVGKATPSSSTSKSDGSRWPPIQRFGAGTSPRSERSATLR